MDQLPKVYVVRHGETEWSKSGQHTGKTDLPLTEHGVEVVASYGKSVVGKDRLLDPSKISKIIVSPRQRAQQTYDKFFGPVESDLQTTKETNEDVQEWDYGDYEGLTGTQIQEKKPGWVIWRDGCPNGESVEDMKARVRKVVNDIITFHKNFVAMRKAGQPVKGSGDVVIFSHGHFSRCFMSCWCELPIETGSVLVVNTGGVNMLGYQHNCFDRKSLMGLNLGSTEISKGYL